MKALALLAMLLLTPLQEMVQTEQSFSKMAADKNTRDAFMEFIADDGLLFRPTAVNGKQWMREHPVPPSDKHPLLAWQPAFADVAAAGDLGFTTGPWELKEDSKDVKPAAYGHFVTLWKKQADGSWKFVVDLGISHPTSGGPLKLWQPDAKQLRKVKSVDVAVTRQALLDRDAAYLKQFQKEGSVKAFVVYASPDVRLYRAGNLPLIGRTLSANALGLVKGYETWTVTSGDVSRSGDLGYTYGTYQIADATRMIEQGSYVRIWKNEGSGWQIVLDVATPH